MPEFLLTVKERKLGPKSLVTNTRQASRVPGVVYGFESESVTIDADYNELLRILKLAGTSHVVKLDLNGKEVKAIVRGFQQDPVTDRVIHVDFLSLKDKRPVTTTVPLKFTGVSRVVKEQGARVNIKNNSVKVKCLPAHLPEYFEIDLSSLTTVGQTISIKDIATGDKVTILNNPNDPVVNVNIPKKIQLSEEEVAAEAKVAEAVAAQAATGEAGTEAKAAEAGTEAKAADTK